MFGDLSLYISGCSVISNCIHQPFDSMACAAVGKHSVEGVQARAKLTITLHATFNYVAMLSGHYLRRSPNEM
jgi:hypothetical protein